MASLHLSDKEVYSVEASSPNGNAVFDQDISDVPTKFRGTSADQHDMAILGKKQVLRVGLWACVFDAVY